MKKATAVICVVLAFLSGCYLTYLITVKQYAASAYSSGSAADKVAEIEEILREYFVDPLDETALGDAAADAVIAATGDRWSYYVPAKEYAQFEEMNNNGYVGVGITIRDEADENGFRVTGVTEGGPAWEAGVEVGDVLVSVDDRSAVEIGFTGTRDAVRGPSGTKVRLGFLRGGENYSCSVSRRYIEQTVSTGKMLEGKIGLVRIENFDTNAGKQAIAAVKELVKDGAEGLVFDVRCNPGGQKDELCSLLDYLLPEGEIFHAVSSDGQESRDYSDASCVKLPMAVLVDMDSYSAAEFFAATLQQYGWAKVVGEKTCGKGNYQYTFLLSDGSAVAVSSGRYYTPSGLRLTDVGVTPDVELSLTDEEFDRFYYGELAPEDDPQIQAAAEILKKSGNNALSR